jgi:ribonuclease HII
MIGKLCGIDEAGRGPWAGPMLIAGVKLHKAIPELNDSKKLSQSKREILYDKIVKNSSYHIVSVDNHTIDKLGLSACLKNAIVEIMQNIDADEYLMDGNTSFGIDNLAHKIKADSTIKEVSAASILAKVTRDRYIVNISKDYPNYHFDKHKGYGTKLHKNAIIKYGFCSIHRLSYNIKGIDKSNTID